MNAERTRTVQVFTRIELEGIHYAAVVDIRWKAQAKYHIERERERE